MICLIVRTVRHDPDHPETVRLAYVYKDKEHIRDYHPAGTDHAQLLDDLISRMSKPISAVRAYRWNELLEERELLMRGN